MKQDNYQKQNTDTLQDLSQEPNVESLLEIILEKLTKIENQIAEIQEQQAARAPRLVGSVKG